MKGIREKFGLTALGAKGVIKASIACFIMYIVTMLPILFFMYSVEQILSGKEGKLLFFLLGVCLLFVLLYMAFHHSYQTTYTETYRESENLRIYIAERLRVLPFSYFSTHNTSDLAQTIMKDVADIEHAISHAVPEAIGFSLYLLLISFLLLWSHLIIGMAILLPIFISFACLFFSKHIQQKGAAKYHSVLRENSEAFQEAIELQQEIKSYEKREEWEKFLKRQMDKSEKIHIRSEIAQAIPVTLSSSVLKFSIGIPLVLGLYFYIRGELSLLYFFGYILAAFKLVDGVQGLYLNFAEIFYLDARTQRILELGQEEVATGTVFSPKDYSIQFQNVSFAYEKGLSTLENISFVAEQNEVTALVGPSGCGKTTLLRVLSRLYDYDSGKILIGGEEIKNTEIESFFQKISMVFQEVLLFDMSVLENIRLGRQTASDEEVKEAARLANCIEFIEKLPQGYDTKIGENGNQLSGGERQRISIARAFLKDAPILLLDEVSASLDIENEMKIQESLSRLMKGKTVIVISHRLKSIEKADKIIVLQNGKIESMGTHTFLQENCLLYQKMLEKSNMTEEFEY